jgi:putative FmdB family regulatory protein
MPLYEYKCSKCGEIFEVLQKFSDAPLTRHKGCRGALHRLVSAAGLHFKGSGWYVNDYAAKGAAGKSEGKTETNSESKSESKSSESKSSESSASESKSGASESKSESKPAAKESKTESKPAKKS